MLKHGGETIKVQLHVRIVNALELEKLKGSIKYITESVGSVYARNSLGFVASGRIDKPQTVFSRYFS